MGWSSLGASGPLWAGAGSISAHRHSIPLISPSLSSRSQCHPARHLLSIPDMLEPAMMPVQPLNITAKTELKLIICPVV